MEILFRARTVNEGKWVQSMTLSRGTIQRKRNKVFLEVQPDKWKGVDPYTVGQFIGRTDKSGQRIFHGDIIRVNSHLGESHYLIRFRPEFAAFCLMNTLNATRIYCPSSWSVFTPHWWDEFAPCIEVIGNEYDNPELLKS